MFYVEGSFFLERVHNLRELVLTYIEGKTAISYQFHMSLCYLMIHCIIYNAAYRKN